MNIGGLASIPTNAVPRQMSMGGQPHMLAYINPQEAQLLKDLGGTGSPTIAGIPAFYNPSEDMGMETSVSDQESVSAGMGATSTSGDEGIGPTDFGLDPFGGMGPNMSVDMQGNVTGIAGDSTTTGGNQGYNPGDVSISPVTGFEIDPNPTVNPSIGTTLSNLFSNITPGQVARGGITALSLISNPVQGLAQAISKGLTINDMVNAAKGTGGGMFSTVGDMVSNISKGLNEQAKGN